MRLFSASCLALVLLTATAVGESWEVCACKGEHYRGLRGLRDSFVPGQAGDGKKYARDRVVDVLHLALDITPDFEKRTLEGVATIRFTPIAKPADQLRLDAVDLEIASIQSTVEILDYEVEEAAIVITFEEAIPPGTEATVTTRYAAQPIEDGLYFRTEAMGYPAGDDHLFTQGEPEKHRHWFPSYDYPNERFTTEITCHVPEGMTVLSNGQKTADATENGTTSITWLQDQPHVNYLVSLVAGHFQGIEEQMGELPIGFFTTPSNFPQAESSFADTEKILAFFEREIGVEYPWDKYFSVCVADFVAGGMENTSLTTLYDGTLFDVAESENIRSTHRLDAHEIAHQWFGDLVTCKDWSELWLNEGFATYYTHLYENERSGRDAMLYGLWRDGSRILKSTDRRPITWRGYDDPFQQFDNRAYPKGSWVLHMLRSQLGDDLFRECIQTYLERHRGGIVETDDLRTIIAEKSGQNWDRFFDQWVHHGGEPELKVSYDWNEKTGLAKISVKQTQKVDAEVMLFDFPLPLRFWTEVDGEITITDHTVQIRETDEDFYLALPSQPKRVRVDPDLTVLTQVEFNKPNPMRYADLEDETDLIGRLRAVTALGGKTDDTSLGKLNKALNMDPFYGVRVEAAKALAKSGTPEALRLLTGSVQQPDARARQEVISALGKFYDETAREALSSVVGDEPNSLIVASALRGIAKYPSETVRDTLTASLGRDSYRNGISSAAIDAIKKAVAVDLLDPVLAELEQDGAAYQSRDFGNGLMTVATLANTKNGGTAEQRSEIRDYLLEQLSHPKAPIRTAAIRALGRLGDPQALGAIDSLIAAGNEDRPEFKAAEEAAKAIRETQSNSQSVSELRTEVLELQKQIRAIRDELNTAKAEAEAKE